MLRVYIASPFRGATVEETRQNIVYARLCVLDCLERGESPYASHLIITQVYAETDALRDIGLRAGDAYRAVSDVVALYVDLGVTDGMRRAEVAAAHRNIHTWTRMVTLPQVEQPRGVEGWRAYLATVPLHTFPALEMA